MSLLDERNTFITKRVTQKSKELTVDESKLVASVAYNKMGNDLVLIMCNIISSVATPYSRLKMPLVALLKDRLILSIETRIFLPETKWTPR